MKKNALILALMMLLGGCVQQPIEDTGPSLADLVSQCGNQINQTEKDLCLSELAEKELEPRLCEEIANDFIRFQCFIQYQSTAKTLKDPALCEKLTYKSQRDECYSEMATTSENIPLCERITITGENHKEESYKNRCYLSAAEETVDTNLCEKISDATKDRCYENIARKTQNTELCDKLSSVEKRDICYMNIAISTKNVSLCNRMERGERQVSYEGNAVEIMDFCHLQVAKAKNIS